MGRGVRVEEEGRGVDGEEEKRGVCQRLIIGGGMSFIYREQLPKENNKGQRRWCNNDIAHKKGPV